MIAETVRGRGDLAWDYYKRICPAYVEESRSELHKVEPYVYAQMIAGKEAYNPGEAKNSWLTGTAAWNYFAITQYILGIRPEFDGLYIDPCIPASWKEFTVVRHFRGTEYRIRITNPDGHMKGVRTLYLDGQKLDGQLVPIMPAGETHQVEVIM